MIHRGLVDVLVDEPIAGADDERRAELEHALAAHVDLVAAAPGADGVAVGLRAEHVPGAAALHAREVRGLGVVIDEDGEWDVLLFDEMAGVLRVTGPDRDEAGAVRLDVAVRVAQLRGMFPAVQSPEVAEENEDDRLLGPVVAEAVVLAVRAGEDELRQSRQIHVRRRIAVVGRQILLRWRTAAMSMRKQFRRAGGPVAEVRRTLQ